MVDDDTDVYIRKINAATAEIQRHANHPRFGLPKPDVRQLRLRKAQARQQASYDLVENACGEAVAALRELEREAADLARAERL